MRIYPSKHQKIVFKKWLGTSRYVYNKALYGTMKKGDPVNKYVLRDTYVTSKYTSNDTVDTYGLNNLFRENKINQWELETPKDIRAGSVFDLCKAYKTCFSQLKTGLVDRFKVGFRRKNKDQSIVIPKSSIRSLGNQVNIYKTYTRKNIKCSRDFKKLKEIKYDCRLKKEGSKWFLIIPYDVEVSKKPGTNGECALDPGARKFQVVYSAREVVKLTRDKIKLKALQDRQKKMQRIRAKKNISSRSVKRSLGKLFRRYKNLLGDFHDKTIKYLTDNYEEIYLPDFKSQEIVKGLSNKTVRNDILSLAHHRFKVRLKDKCELYQNTKVVICTEEYTTKTCTGCGELNDVGCKELYKCRDCGLVTDRDINGARNIFLKYTK